VTIRQHGRIHRASRRAGDSLYMQPRLFQQTIQHSPGKGTMRATPLQREVDQHRIADALCRRN
jgi:hypothetical protein